MPAATDVAPPTTPSRAAPKRVEAPQLRDGLRYLARLLMLARPYWRGLLTGVLLGVVASILGMVPPYLSKLFIDTVYPARDLPLLDAIALGLVVVSGASALIGALQTYCTEVVGSRLTSATSLLFFNQLQHMPVRFFDEHAVGEIQRRFVDVELALDALTNATKVLLVSGVYLVIVPPILFMLNWRLALIALGTAPITGLVTTLTGAVIRRHWQRTAELDSELNAFQTEVLSQIRTFKTLAAERFVYTGARARTEATLSRQLHASGMTAVMMLVNNLTRVAGTVVFSWFGWTLVVHDQLSVGAFVAFSAYVGYLTAPIAQITGLVSSFQRATVSLSRMFEYIDAPVEQDPNLVRHPPAPQRRGLGELQISGVSFGYSAERPVLQDVSLTFRPGTVTAIVGSSGSGKSSLLRLLCRLETAEQGAILLDGVPIGTLPLAELRGQVTAVWQEVSLLRGTLLHNLTIGLDDPSPEMVREAIRVCQLEEMLRALPDGYDTEVGEWGATLSGGQRQRIAIARALLRQSPVLLLDEVTSQVDVHTEEQILRELFEHVRDKTVIFVTHRVSTAALADQICVLEGGRIAAVDTHAELSATCESYRGMLRVAGMTSQRPLRVLVADR